MFLLMSSIMKNHIRLHTYMDSYMYQRRASVVSQSSMVSQ